MNTRRVSWLLVALMGTTAGCDMVKKLAGGKADPGDTSETGDGAEHADSAKNKKKSKGAAKAGCALPDDRITQDVTLEKGCKLDLAHSVTVGNGAVLTLEEGVTLGFAPSTYLSIEDAKLVVAGTEKAPVTLTSSNDTKAAGDWVGLFIYPEAMAGTRIEHARIEYAGQDASGGRAAVTVTGERSVKRLAIVGTTFANNDRAAVYFEGVGSAFAELKDNRFESNEISLSAAADVLGSVGTGNTFGDPIETWGQITQTATWPAFGVPVVAKESLRIAGASSAPTLTLARGTTIRFAPGTYFTVGEDKGGALVAPGCTFTSSNETPQAGDWVGFFIYKLTQRVDLAGSTIEAAGHDGSGGRAAITFFDVDLKDARNVDLAGLTVKNSAAAALSSGDHDCGALAPQITAIDVPVCRAE